MFYDKPYTLAHEIGHQLLVTDEADDKENVMYKKVVADDATCWRLRHWQWSTINNDKTNPLPQQ